MGRHLVDGALEITVRAAVPTSADAHVHELGRLRFLRDLRRLGPIALPQEVGEGVLVVGGRRVDGQARAYDVRADFIVSRGDRRWVAEVKTGHKAPNPTGAATRCASTSSTDSVHATGTSVSTSSSRAARTRRAAARSHASIRTTTRWGSGAGRAASRTMVSSYRA